MCPKCGQSGVLEGTGIRRGTRSIMGMGDVRVFSGGVVHKGCPVHGKGELLLLLLLLIWCGPAASLA